MEDEKEETKVRLGIWLKSERKEIVLDNYKRKE